MNSFPDRHDVVSTPPITGLVAMKAVTMSLMVQLLIFILIRLSLIQTRDRATDA